jgi:hypothetical protein
VRLLDESLDLAMPALPLQGRVRARTQNAQSNSAFIVADQLWELAWATCVQWYVSLWNASSYSYSTSPSKGPLLEPTRGSWGE